MRESCWAVKVSPIASLVAFVEELAKSIGKPSHANTTLLPENSDSGDCRVDRRLLGKSRTDDRRRVGLGKARFE